MSEAIPSLPQYAFMAQTGTGFCLICFNKYMFKYNQKNITEKKK